MGLRSIFWAFLLPMLLHSKPPVRIEIVLNEKLWNRWVVIVFNQKTCPPINFNQDRVVITVPDSGFVCTSSPIPHPGASESFYVIDSKMRKKKIEPKKHIHLYISTSTSGGPAVSPEEFAAIKEKMEKEWDDPSFWKKPNPREIYRAWQFFYGEEKALWEKDPNRLSPTEIAKKHGIKTEVDATKSEPEKKD